MCICFFIKSYLGYLEKIAPKRTKVEAENLFGSSFQQSIER